MPHTKPVPTGAMAKEQMLAPSPLLAGNDVAHRGIRHAELSSQGSSPVCPAATDVQFANHLHIIGS